MDRETFLQLPTPQVADVMRQAGSTVCVFPINGTRRWFMLEHTQQATPQTAPSSGDSMARYLDVAGKRHIELYQMLFAHGIDTLLTPIFGPDLLERGDEYITLAVDGMIKLVTDPQFLDFYDAYDVRVRFYGDFQCYLAAPQAATLAEKFAALAARTASHHTHRLFFGVCAHDASETTAALAVQFFQQHGRVPDKDELIALYYGEAVPPVALFISAAPFHVFDMPLLLTGHEDLYFTVSPSPYMTAAQLRAILYDHLYVRPAAELDYAALQPSDWDRMRAFYHANRNHTLGVGARAPQGGYWYPLPQAHLPAEA